MKTNLSLETMTQLAVFLENRPGTLGRVCEALAQAGINIHALTVSDTVDHAVVRMIVSDPSKALMLFGERGVLAFENDVLYIEAANEAGVLGQIADALSRAEVNIEYAYFATSATSRKGIIVLRPSNVEKARAALSAL
ncbi:MAG TPA: ACT domain-containing protein [Chthoniobacterales bacterium]